MVFYIFFLPTHSMDDCYVLGMTLGHNATAALTHNGRVIACVSEERFTRIKNVYGYPEKAAQYCLNYAGIDGRDLELVVLSSHITPPLKQTSEGFKEESRGEGSLSWFSILSKIRGHVSKVKTLDQMGYQNFAPLLAKMTHKNRVQILSSLLHVAPEKIISSEHHTTHAYSAIFSSDFFQNAEPDEKVLVITVDGEGDMFSSSVGIFTTSTLNYERIAQSSFAESIGHFYSAVTSYLGMRVLEHEYKVMGLAPYSYSHQADALLKKLSEHIWIDDDLKIRTKVHSHHFENTLHELFKGIRFDYVAAASQKLVEMLLVDLVKKAIAKTGIHTIALAGGVIMNVKANYEILKLPGVKKMFVMPSCGDESLPIGSCYYGTLQNHKEVMGSLPPLNHLYFGPEYSHEYIEKVLGQNNFEYKDYGRRIGVEVSRLLSEGNVVARFDGKMEFGARAMGNRSILADASNGDVVEIINRMIKKRDFWMPFAPSIIEEYADYYILHPELLQKVKPYFMMVTFESTPLARRDLKAAMHPYDKTIRPQLVNKFANPRYYELLTYYLKRTGRYGLLNTSFNIHGEPIVCSPEDALKTLRESGLQYLSLGDFLVYKA